MGELGGAGLIYYRLRDTPQLIATHFYPKSTLYPLSDASAMVSRSRKRRENRRNQGASAFPNPDASEEMIFVPLSRGIQGVEEWQSPTVK